MLSNKKAFTLIELLVVVLIVGILAAVAVPQYQKAVLKSKAVQFQVLLKTIRDAQEVYYLEHGLYASNLSDLDIVPQITDSRVLLYRSCVSHQPRSTYVYWDKMPGLLFIDAYRNQCADYSWGSWADHTKCYAYDQQSSRFCAYLANQPIRQCTSHCIYSIR